MFWEIFFNLCRDHNTTPNAVCAELGFSTATSTHWKRGSIPKGDSLSKIAKYFNVSTDYLIGKTDDPRTSAQITADYLNDSPSDATEKKPDNVELDENIIIYQRNGKTIRKKMSKEKMELLSAMLDALPDNDNADL